MTKKEHGWKKLPYLWFWRFRSPCSLPYLMSAQVTADSVPVYDSKNNFGNVLKFKAHTTLVAAMEATGLVSVMGRVLLPG